MKGSEMAGRMLCHACESTMWRVGRPGGSVLGGGRRDQAGRGGEGGDKRGGKMWGTAVDGDHAAIDGPGDGLDGVSEAATGGAVLCVTGNVMGRVAEAHGLCGLLPVDMAVDGANRAEGEAAFVHRPGTPSGHSEGMWTETGVTGDVGIAAGVRAEPNEGRTTCPEGQDGCGTRESDPDK